MDNDQEMTFEGYQASQYAIRDIMFMYRELCNYRGLYEDFGWEDGDFDPFQFVDITDLSGLCDDDLRLLREGSAIKLLCWVLQAYAQGGYPDYKSEYMQRIQTAHKQGRLRHIPELELALGEGLVSRNALESRSHAIFHKYVLGYLLKFANEVADSARRPRHDSSSVRTSTST